METETTMEVLLETIQKSGWRMSNLSHIRGQNAYSCILERDKGTNDGFGVYASSSLCDNPRDALAEAWVNAGKKLEELNQVKPSKILSQSVSVEKSPMAGKLIGALSRWLDALDPQEDF